MAETGHAATQQGYKVHLRRRLLPLSPRSYRHGYDCYGNRGCSSAAHCRITVENCSSRPVTRFDQCGFTRGVLKCTEAFLRPSPIQATCWPVVLSGRDMVGVSATGSGKTLAFGLPALMHILAQRKAGLVQGKNPKVLVLSPTRCVAIP